MCWFSWLAWHKLSWGQALESTCGPSGLAVLLMFFVLSQHLWACNPYTVPTRSTWVKPFIWFHVDCLLQSPSLVSSWGFGLLLIFIATGAASSDLCPPDLHYRPECPVLIESLFQTFFEAPIHSCHLLSYPSWDFFAVLSNPNVVAFEKMRWENQSRLKETAAQCLC